MNRRVSVATLLSVMMVGVGVVIGFHTTNERSTGCVIPRATPHGADGSEMLFSGVKCDTPTLPVDLTSEPYNCEEMANTERCLNIYIRDPMTGWCTELDYIAPMAVGTVNGWLNTETDPDDYLCPPAS